MRGIGSYPWKKPSCAGDMFWFFVGDDGNEYSDCNGAIDYAILNIGYRNPHLKTLTRKHKNGVCGRPMNVDKFFNDLRVTRPKE